MRHESCSLFYLISSVLSSRLKSSLFVSHHVAFYLRKALREEQVSTTSCRQYPWFGWLAMQGICSKARTVTICGWHASNTDASWIQPDCDKYESPSSLSTPLLTHPTVACSDPRVSPELFLNIAPGGKFPHWIVDISPSWTGNTDLQASFIRVAGGRAVDALRSLIVLDEMLKISTVVVIHHTGKFTSLPNFLLKTDYLCE